VERGNCPGAIGWTRRAHQDFREPLERELHCPVGSLLNAALTEGKVRHDEQPLAERDLDALIGWTLNRGA